MATLIMTTFKVPVGISSRHVHLTQEHVEILFGRGHSLTPLKPLSQPGQFACEETVTLMGSKGSIDDVRVLGPVRKASQVEIATTDSYKLGVKAPVRESGKLEGTPGIDLLGTKGMLHLKSGLIIAARHIHMSPDDAQKYGLKDGDYVSAEIPGPRGGILENILIRVSPKYSLDMHLDTDEANAFNLREDDSINVIVD